VAAVLADSVAVAAASVVAAQVEAGRRMRTKEFLGKLEHNRIVRAIQDAELKSSGQIRVHIQRGKLDGDALVVAQNKFDRLGMHKTRERNAVLIYVAPRAHKFAIVGDKAIHEKCGDSLWQRVVAKMREHFRNERFSDAVVDAIRDIGEVLAEHFPRKDRGGNELPDNVVET
jgi:uncharacterized membrane protein